MAKFRFKRRMGRYWSWLKEVPSDLRSGLTLGIESIPDGMASSVLAGLNPVYGLHTAMIALTVGALRTSSVFMAVTTTSAMSIAVGAALTGMAGESRVQAAFLLTILVGLIMLVVGLLRLGSLVRFFSNSAMVGFLTGVAILIVLSQIPALTGYESPQSNTVLQAVDALYHIGEAQMAILIVGLLSIALIAIVGRTRFHSWAMITGVVVTSLVVLLLGMDSVPLVKDFGVSSSVLPLPNLPDLSLLDLELLAWALAISIVGLVQSAGISRTYPNPDGKLPEASRDFTGQGLANLATGILQGIPAGGSISATALVVSSGAKSRLANIFAGSSIIIMMVFLGGFIGELALPSLAGLLVVVGFQTINMERISEVWQTNRLSRGVMIFSLATTLAFPLQYAIFGGVIVSAILHIYRASKQAEVKELVRHEDGSWEESPAPSHLLSDTVTVLDFHGSLFYGGAWTIERNLPETTGSHHPVVVFRLHGQSEIGSTFMGVIERYAKRLKACGGKLMLAGVSEDFIGQLRRTKTIDIIGQENVFPVGRRLQGGINEAESSGRRWIEGTIKENHNR